MKTINKILLIYIILAVLIISSLGSCATDLSEPALHTSVVIRSGVASVYEFGDFLYFSKGPIFRYNTATAEMSSACLDPECGNKCPLHCGFTRIGALEDGKLYFFAFMGLSDNIYLAYQDLISGDVTVLDTLSENEFAREVTFINDGYFYYYAGVLKDGGNERNQEDYEIHLCRISTSGGERDVLETPSGIPQMIVNGKLVMIGNNISIYDLETKLEKVVWNYTEYGFKKVSELSYVNGKIFALAETSSKNCEMMVNQYTGVTYANNTFLVSVDINTGEWMKVTEEAVESYAATDDRIYYYPTDLRYLYVPANYEKNPDGVKVSFFSATLYSRKHDGSDLKSEYTNESINTCYDYTVIGGKLYGNISLYDEAESNSARSKFCAIDLAMGEIIDYHDVRN